MTLGVLPGGGIPRLRPATFHAVRAPASQAIERSAIWRSIPPFVVRVEKQSEGSFGETMSLIRSWLDHRHIQPTSFQSVADAQSGVGFEIGFNSEDEAHLFKAAFRA